MTHTKASTQKISEFSYSLKTKIETKQLKFLIIVYIFHMRYDKFTDRDKITKGRID